MRADSPADSAAATADVVLTGTVFFDIVFTGLPRPPEPGVEVWTDGMGSSPGGIANLAVAASRLGLQTMLAAVFSDDGYGQWCWGILAEQEGIDLTCSHTHARWHTPVTVSMAYGGDRAMVTHGHRAPCTASPMLAQAPVARAAFVDLQADDDDAWWQRIAALGSKVFADVGWDPSGVWDRAMLRRLDGAYCFTPNRAEACAYTRTETAEDAARALGEYVPLAVVTCGQDGAVAFDSQTGELVAVPALEARAIDPTGAGDVFAACLVKGTLEGWSLEERLRFSALAASLSVGQFGGALAAPGWGDIADWWRCTRDRATQGCPTATRLTEDYAFLPALLPVTDAPAVRRANATFARFSDVRAGHIERTS